MEKVQVLEQLNLLYLMTLKINIKVDFTLAVAFLGSIISIFLLNHFSYKISFIVLFIVSKSLISAFIKVNLLFLSIEFKKSKFSWESIYGSLVTYFDNPLSPIAQVFLADYNGKLLYNFNPINTKILT